MAAGDKAGLVSKKMETGDGLAVVPPTSLRGQAKVTSREKGNTSRPKVLVTWSRLTASREVVEVVPISLGPSPDDKVAHVATILLFKEETFLPYTLRRSQEEEAGYEALFAPSGDTVQARIA